MTDALLTRLAAAGTHTADRLQPALAAAEALITRRTPAPVAAQAIAAFHAGLEAAGGQALAGGDPQAIEDAVYAADPKSPLSESVLRNAWLALADALARTGDKPPFGGSGAAETWAFTARSRPWPYVGHGDLLGEVLALHGEGVQVVCVRGPGRSAFLAALRRGLLAKAGADAFVPAVTPAARDDIAGLLRPYLARAPLDKKLKDALPQLQLGEDLIGVFGRVGDQTPVALLLDDAHLQSRAFLLGLTLFVEPAPNRAALLVVAGPADRRHDGPLNELLLDARRREILTEIDLPAWDASLTADLLAERFGERRPAEVAETLAALPGERPAVQMTLAHAWLDDLDALDAGFDLEAHLPKHVAAQRILAFAALEGGSFHGFAVGTALGEDEDYVEDLLHDDEFELEGSVVGTCEAAVPAGNLIWAKLPDGLHPVFEFIDPRIAPALRATLTDDDRKARAGALRDGLIQGYTLQNAWQVADRIWRLDLASGRPRMVAQVFVSTRDPRRVEMGFRRMLPILQAQEVYQLALGRLYGTAMEFGQLCAATGKAPHASQAYQAAAAAAQRLQRIGPAGEALARLAEIQLALALPQAAVRTLDVAEQLLNKAGHAHSVVRGMLLRSEAKILSGDLRGAEKQLRTCVQQLRESKDGGHLALALMRLGRLLYELGDHDPGIAALDEAIRTADAAGDPRPAAATRLARAFVYAEQSQLDPAFARLNEAAQAFRAIGMPVHVVEVAAADLQRRHGNPETAEKRLRTVGEAFKKANAAVQWADAWHGVARCLIDQKKFTDAVEAIDEIIEVRKRARDRFALVRLYDDLGEAKAGQGDAVGAFVAFSTGRAIAQRLTLAARLGSFDARLHTARQALDAVADADADALSAQAVAEIEAMEALWARPPEAAAPSNDKVH